MAYVLGVNCKLDRFITTASLPFRCFPLMRLKSIHGFSRLFFPLFVHGSASKLLPATFFLSARLSRTGNMKDLLDVEKYMAFLLNLKGNSYKGLIEWTWRYLHSGTEHQSDSGFMTVYPSFARGRSVYICQALRFTGQCMNVRMINACRRR